MNRLHCYNYLPSGDWWMRMPYPMDSSTGTWRTTTMPRTRIDTRSARVEATARLDRWYVSAPLMEWIAAVEVWRTETQADHHAVRLHLRNPTDPVRVRKPTKVYPPPTIASEAVCEVTKRMLQEFADGLPSDLTDAAHWAREWDALKTAIRKETLQIIKQRRKTARASYKQRVKRLLRQERRLREAAAGHTPTVDTIPDTLDVLTLSEGCGSTPLQRVRHAIKTCARKRASTQQRRLFQTGVYRAGKTTKAFSDASALNMGTTKFIDLTRLLDTRLGASMTWRIRSPMHGPRSFSKLGPRRRSGRQCLNGSGIKAGTERS